MISTIALVDDDKNILTSLSLALKAQGFDVVQFTDGQSALSGFEKKSPDLAVFDIKMPRMDGMELLHEVRASWNFPVIFLTSKDEEHDALMGFKMGADDYITKPFSPSLLIARIRACLRRYDNSTNAQETITRGALILDDTRHLCTWSDQEIDLTVTEYLLLKALASRAGNVKTRAALVEQAYGQNSYTDDRTIDSHIKRIRQKLRKADDGFDMIETLYGIGYRYKEEDK